MPITLIASNPIEKKEAVDPALNNKITGLYLNVAEMFCDTIQGEGISTGVPSTFLRLQGCTLDCKWCDTQEVWRFGNPYSPWEIFELWEKAGMIEKFKAGQHLILTGGSPLKQQDQLAVFIALFIAQYNFKPFIEVENEAVLMPKWSFDQFVDQWNNSPKLANSGMKSRARYRPEILRTMSEKNNSWFKFVVESESDWAEIKESFLEFDIIKKSQIILMPCGATQEELAITRPIVADMAIKHGVRFCDRLHVTLWNKATSV